MTKSGMAKDLVELKGRPYGFKIAPKFPANCSGQGALNRTASKAVFLCMDPTWNCHLESRGPSLKPHLFTIFITQSI